MTYIWKYDTPLELDNMLMSSDDKYLTGYGGGIKKVIGASNKLIGYGGGIKNKIVLLEIEGHNLEEYKLSKEKKYE